jgi:hypothetical protein
MRSTTMAWIFFIHQETLSEDLKRLGTLVGLPVDLVVPEYNVTKAMDENKTYKDYYDDELIALVYEKNAPFFDRFLEYSFEGLDESKIRKAPAFDQRAAARAVTR